MCADSGVKVWRKMRMLGLIDGAVEAGDLAVEFGYGVVDGGGAPFGELEDVGAWPP